MKKVLWFSRHEMTTEQKEALGGNVDITQISGTFPNVHVPFQDSEGNELPPFKEIIKEYDVIAIVLPIHLEKQVLDIAGDKPVIKAMNQRQLVRVEGKEDKVNFIFTGWKRLVKIEVVMEDYKP